MAVGAGAGGGDSNTTHIVVVPFPAQGHLALLHLCKRLASNGILITIALVESMHKQMLKSWTPHPNIRLESIPFDFNLPFGYDANVQSNLKVEFNTAFSSLGPEFERLFRGLDPAPVCIIADDFIAWSRYVWRNLGVPLITYWPGSASWSSVHQHVDLLTSNGDCPLTDSCHEIIDYVPGLSPLKPTDLPDYCQYVDKENLVAFCKLRVEDVKLVIVNSFYELEPKTFDVMKEVVGPKFVSVGPLFPLDIQSKDTGSINTSLRPEQDECLKWLDSQSAGSVLYISFGSCSSMSGKESEEFVLGLAASKQRFLWVLNNEVVNDEKEYERCKEVTREYGMIVPWVPQLKVLAHPAVGGFLTHCGWNSLFESICSGVPMLCFPRHSDQPLNCKLVAEDWKIGLRLNQSGGALEKEKVASVIEEFMSDQDIRTNVKKLQLAARAATASGGSSSSNVDHLLQLIKTL